MGFNELQELDYVHMTFTEVKRLETNLSVTCESPEQEAVQARAKVVAEILVREYIVSQPLHIWSLLCSALCWLKLLFSCIHLKISQAF